MGPDLVLRFCLWVGFDWLLRIPSSAQLSNKRLALFSFNLRDCRRLGSSGSASLHLRLAAMGSARIRLAALIAAPFADWTAITERQTNIDIVARTVAARAASTDLIVVAPWQFGVTFQRYYRGPASWVTIPSIADHQVHRYDLIKSK